MGGSATVIELCGSLQVEIAGRDVTALLPGRQGRALFAFLVVNRHRPVARHELLHVLWPDDPPDAPEAGLSTILTRVRRAVGDGIIDGRTELRLRLGDEVDIDVERAVARSQDARRALAAGDGAAATTAAREALTIVESPLLPGVEGDWVEAHRGELAELEPDLLEVLARAALLGGDREQLASAERAARALVDRHPFRESGYALLIEIQARLGNIAEATLTFDRIRVLLRDELGTTPSAELSALHEQLLHGGRLAPQPSPAEVAPAGGGVVPLPVIGGIATSTPFVGRAEPLERLRGPWHAAVGGERRFELVMGEPGVGKTRLAAQFAAEVHAAGATVLYGRCDEEPLLAYQPFVTALGHYLQHGDWGSDAASEADLRQLSRLLPEARPSDGVPAESFPKDAGSERYLLFAAVARLVDRATRSRPLLVVLDDLHWADKPTLLLLRHMVRLTDPARLMLLGMFREGDVDPDHPLFELVADMRREKRFDRLALEGLDEHETDELVAARLDATATAGFVRGLRSQTEGNPFFIEEALRSLVQTHAVETGTAAREDALATMGVPDSVADVILRRLGGLEPETQVALRAAAVVGREFDLKIVQALLDVPADDVLDTIDEAMAAGLVGEVAGAFDRFMFCHALVRDAIYDRVSRSRLLRLHLRVGTVIEEAGGDVGELARHFFEARELGVAGKAARYSMLAGERAATALAYEDSAEHYGRALEAVALDPDGDESTRCDILLALGRVQWRAGETAARLTYFQAADSARERGDARRLAAAALGLGERYWEAGAVDKPYEELVSEAIGALGDEDSRARALLMARLAEHVHFTAEQGYGEKLSREAVEMARRLGDVDTLKPALMARHVALLHIEHLDERLALIDEVMTLAKGHRPLTAEAHHWRLLDLWELGDIAEAHRDHAELTRLATELRQPVLGYLARGWESMFAHLAGDVDGAERLAFKSYEFGARAQVGSARSSLASMLYTLRRQQGRIAELLPDMFALEDGGSANPAWRAALALAQVETGAVDEGRERFERLAGTDFSAIPRDWFWIITAALLAETCAALDDGDRAARLYDLLAPFADRFVQVIFTASWGSAHRYLGILAGTTERFDDAQAHFEAALAANARMGAVLMTAETRCSYGALLLRRGRGGDRERASELGALAEQVAAPRGLADLSRRARALRGAPDRAR